MGWNEFPCISNDGSLTDTCYGIRGKKMVSRKAIRRSGRPFKWSSAAFFHRLHPPIGGQQRRQSLKLFVDSTDAEGWSLSAKFFSWADAGGFFFYLWLMDYASQFECLDCGRVQSCHLLQDCDSGWCVLLSVPFFLDWAGRLILLVAYLWSVKSACFCLIECWW